MNANMETEEIWKQFRDSYYFVSNKGRVKSHFNSKERILEFNDDGHGYLKVTMYLGVTQITIKVHQLVAELFLVKPEGILEINHKDCNKQNNHDDNLEWITHRENMIHAWTNNRCDKGEDSYLAILTEKEVAEIKLAFVEYKLSNTELAKKYGVAKGTISKIRSKQTWKDIMPELMYLPSSPDESNKKKLCGADIPLIRDFYNQGFSLAEIGRKFNVHSGTINGIVTGKTWINY